MTTRYKHNSTIGVKQRICVSCGKPCFWFSKKRCQTCATQEDTMKRMESETEQVIKEEDLSGLIADADAVISRYVRLSEAHPDGTCHCYTCGVRKHWSLQQCGHFIPRSCLYLRYDLRNLKIQCVDCNEFKSGNIPEYARRLEIEYPGLPDLLREEARLVYKTNREEVRFIISEYTPKVKQLLHNLK